MRVTTSIDKSRAALVLEGKLTVEAAPVFSAAVDKLPITVCDIDIDMAGVPYVSSAGLRVLASTDKLAVARGGVMRVLHPREDVLEMLERVGLSELFAIRC